MTTPYLPSLSQRLGRALLPLFAVGAAVAYAQTPGQLPLLTKTGAGVPPNIMLTLDDSGSMAFQHMPEDKFSSDTFATTNPVNSRTVRWDPNDNYNIGVNFAGTVPGNINSTNYVLRALRSPDTNSVFYNPEIRYQPWFTNDGVTRRANSPVAKAFKNPLIQTGAAGTYVNLTSYEVPSGTSRWCYSGASTASAGGAGCADVANNSATLHHDPGVYFRLGKTAGVYKAVDGYSNYTGFSINAPGPFTKYPARLDCLGATCSQAEERQNFANWFSYYRNRNLLARGAMMEAFAAETNTFRLGFGRINKGSASVDGVNTSVIESSATYGGGGVRPFTAARKVNLFKWLDDLPANGGTPLVEALKANGEYYSRTDNRGPWTDDPSTTNTVANNKTCRRSYTIISTDGYWNGPGVTLGASDADANSDNTDGATITGIGASYKYVKSKPYADGAAHTLADVAMHYWKTDLQPSTVNAVPAVGDNVSFWQNMTNFTVGLGVRGSLNPSVDLPALTAGTKAWPAAGSGQTAANVDDLWHAAVNSRGKYFSAKDPKELADAIKTVLSGATGSGGATAGVATASTVLSATNRKYVPTFTPTSWNGDIAANPLNASGQVTAAVWNAADRMPAWSARNIVTWDSGLTNPAGVAFKWASISAANKAALGTVAGTHTTKFIDFLWGDHSNEGVGYPFRSRVTAAGTPFILGDFVNANPVLVQDNYDGMYNVLGLGSGTSSDPYYGTFINAKAARTSLLFAGGNDGMLHAFIDSKGKTPASALTDGQEVFAYVPRGVYSNLEKLADKTYGTAGVLEHQFYVDGPLRESDAYVKAPGASSASWRNYLLGSLGAGGRTVFALDVTNLTSLGPNTVRWEISSTDDADLGYVMSPIKVGVLPNGRWVAVFGNGFSSTNGYASLFVVDIEDAASTNPTTRANAVQKLTVDNTGGNGLGGVTLFHDATGQIAGVYAGDLKGNMWKFIYSASAASKFTVSGGAAVFTATTSGGAVQPITSSPALFLHAQGGHMIIFGTGKLFATADATDTTTQSVYGVWDKPADSLSRPLSRGYMAPRTLNSFSGTGGASGTTFYSLSGSAVDWNAERGYVIDLGTSIPGGRVIYPTQVIGYDSALVTAVAPVQGTPAACDSLSGTGLNLALAVKTGLNPPNHTLDTNGDGVADASDTYAVGYGTRADGIDAVISSKLVSGGGGSGASAGCPAGQTCTAPLGSSVNLDGVGGSGGGGNSTGTGGAGPTTTGNTGEGTSQKTDAGGGVGEQTCLGVECSSGGKECVPSPLCPEANTCLSLVQSATSGMTICVDSGTKPTGPGPNPRSFDRVWRRIINPPIK